MVIFRLERDKYSTTTTLGSWLNLDGSFFGHTLEPAVRANGVKVIEKDSKGRKHGRTAIKGGTPECPERYKVIITKSRRFKRDMLIYSNTKDYWLIEYDGIKFKGIRAHGGNSYKDTNACTCIAKNRYDWKIQGTLEKELTALVQTYLDNDENVCLDVVNLPQP